MASSWLQVFTNPHRLAALLLSIATCLLTLTILPPSSAIYLIRADYNLNAAASDAVHSTTWFGNLGYCTSDAADDVLNPSHTTPQCTPVMIQGYTLTTALPHTQSQQQTASLPPPNLSIILTRGASILNPLAIGLLVSSIAAYQSILQRPRGVKYAVSMGASFLAFLLSGVGFVFEHSLCAYVAASASSASASTQARDAEIESTSMTTVMGPAYHAVIASLVVQLAASVVGFYSCIGGKYQCEAEERRLLLEGEDGESGSGGAAVALMASVDSEFSGLVHESSSSSFDEKCPL